MLQDHLNASLLVQVAVAFQALGYLAPSQLVLRLLLLVGTVFYVLYYFFISDSPLWEAIVTSSMLGTINLIMICVLILERTTFRMSSEWTAIYQNFRTLTPGQFRRLMKCATITTCEADMELCAEDRPTTHLYHCFRGELLIRKDGFNYSAQAPILIGELGLLTGRFASASVTARKGSVLVSWHYSDIQRLMHKSALLKNALIALFNLDMAAKLGRAIPPTPIASP